MTYPSKYVQICSPKGHVLIKNRDIAFDMFFMLSTLCFLPYTILMDSLRKKNSREIPPNFPEKPAFSNTKLPEKNELFISRQESERLSRKYEGKIKQRQRSKKIFFSISFFLGLIIFSYFGYFIWKTVAVANKMSNAQNANFGQNMRAFISPIIPMNTTRLKGEESGRINILLLGAASERNAGRDLTDTVMLMSVDVKNKRVALLSLPRDLYVNIPGTQTFTKINGLYKIGLSQKLGVGPIKKTVEQLTGLPIDYYLVVDFDGFTKIIDDLGGINVISERDFYDPTYPGPNYSYETFSLSKGFHQLDGNVALKYVRERHSDPEGDFGRAKRQQQVIQAVKSKLFSMETFFNAAKLNDILNTLGDNVKTDISLEDITSFIGLSKKVDTQNITNIVLDAWKPDSLLKVSHVDVGGTMAFILVPRVGNYSEIQDLAQNIFNQRELKRREQAISEENAKIEIINKSSDAQLANKVRKLLVENLGLKNAQISQTTDNEKIRQTTVSDNSKGLKIFTLDELLKKLPATLSTRNDFQSSSKADLIVFLGEDLIDSYKFETDSIEAYNKAQNSQANFDFTKEN